MERKIQQRNLMMLMSNFRFFQLSNIENVSCKVFSIIDMYFCHLTTNLIPIQCLIMSHVNSIM